jgi:hypothetical protein
LMWNANDEWIMALVGGKSERVKEPS